MTEEERRAHERAHDERLVATLEAAEFEEQAFPGRVLIRLAHLHGEITVGENFFWSAIGHYGGEAPGPAWPMERELTEAGQEAMAYCRAAVRLTLRRIRVDALREAKRRLGLIPPSPLDRRDDDGPGLFSD